MVIHIDLFSGIGGFAYAIDQIYGKTKHIFVENDPFCTAVLKKHWPEAEYYGDIRTFTYADRRLYKQPKRKIQTRRNATFSCDFLTGGFPCQPFSQAGIRKGTSDDRYLWPEMLRVIREAKPRWVIAENVRGILTIQNGLVFERVCLDLEGAGYEVRAFIIPAVAVGAPHRRDRVWFVANSTSERLQESRGKTETRYGKQKNSDTIKREVDWSRNWKEVAFATCYDRVDDGLSRRMDGTTISGARHRKERLKACGNAIVPQVAMKILKAIKDAN